MFNWSGQNAAPQDSNIALTGATVRMFDQSTVPPTVIDAAQSGAATVEADQWWSVFTLDAPNPPEPLNRLQPTASSSYAQGAGTGIGKIGIITGRFWDDWNFNNVFDTGFESLYGYGTIRLVIDGDSDGYPWSEADTVVQAAQTDAAGRFMFVNVPLGTYLIDSGWSGSTAPTFDSVTMDLTGRVVLPGKGLNIGT